MAGTNAQVTAGPGTKVAGGVLALEAAPGKPALKMEEHPAWPMISRLPVMLLVNIQLSGFRVCDLLNLERGQTVESAWATTEDVLLKVGELQIGWGEFEVVEASKALRLTRLA